jgi:hypothetical protein
MKVIPDLILSVPNEGYSRNVLYALNKISIYVYYNMLQSLTNLKEFIVKSKMSKL